MIPLVKFGYEGEGPMLGRRTAYASFPEVTVQSAADQSNFGNVDSLYFVIESNHQEFVQALSSCTLGIVKAVTLDFPVQEYTTYMRLGNVIRFLRCDWNTQAIAVPAHAAKVAHTYLKMVCETSFRFGDYVKKANELAELGHFVLLMPDFWMDAPALLGKEMMRWFDSLHPRVRVMPPVHHVLRMP